jgi:hypothetical protein
MYLQIHGYTSLSLRASSANLLLILYWVMTIHLYLQDFKFSSLFRFR